MVVTIFSASEKQFVPPHLPRDEEAETASLLPKPTKAHVEAGPRRHTHTSPRARVMKSEKPKTVLPKRSDSGAKGRGDWDFEMVDLGSEFSPRGFSEAAERESGKESREDKLVSGIRGKVDGFFSNLLGGLRNLTTPMRMVLLVTALSWVAWFPFLLYSTDFMGREIYGGEPKTKDHDKYLKYEEGVEKGALGLLLNSVVGAGTALMIDPLCRLLGSERIWALSNFIQFACMTAMARLSMLAQTVASANDNHTLGNWSHYASTLIFAILGAPFAITLSIPYALMGEFTAEEGGGQGLSMGILNLAIVLPQVSAVSISSYVWLTFPCNISLV
ncbi:hypothetical protein CBR_g135 [Chara braunii]|uniref:Uncharacterized protein n=1 Tax=Chara braunii TaxID=69332 RepID=A0A388JLX1_CHABU|nr:hypothetical protein CBR_g135 [Chara braunii]|eukprot:GBG58735.1 hypothetical protein CBR_g135 [Chara braunii]